MDRIQSALDCIDFVRSQSEDAILMCSLGKDSLVTLDMIYPRFRKVYCVFMYFVPGLEHIERWVRWVKARYPKVEFVQIPHWNLSYIQRGGLYCVANPDVKLIQLKDVVKALRLRFGCQWVFLGFKRADSMNRRLMIDRLKDDHYTLNGQAFPLADWTQKEILGYMKNHDLPEPIRYSKNASGGLGFGLDCFLWMRDNGYQQDLEKIYNVFPLSRRILYEYDYKQKHA